MQGSTYIIGPDRAVAEVWETLGAAGITIEASSTYPSPEGRNVRIVIQDEHADAARDVLLDAGFGAIDRREVLIADIENRPGELGRLARRIADKGATLTTLFMAMGDRVVIGADNLDLVRSALADPSTDS